MKPSRGVGSLYQQKGSPYWWVQYFENGTRFRESTKTTDIKKAERFLRTRLGQISSHTFITPDAEKVTVQELADSLFAEYTANNSKSLHTVRNFRWSHLEPVFAHRRAADIKRDDLTGYATSRQAEGASNATINRELSALRKMFSLAVEASKVRTAPKFPHLREDNVRTGFVTDDKYAALAEACGREALWLRTMFELAYTYGWRRSELTGLRVRQVNQLDRTIRLDVGSTKNGDGREVVMTAAVHTLLTACVSGKGPDDYVFSHQNGDPIGDFRKRWEKVCTAAGTPGLLFHDLRRSGVRNMVRAGIPEHVAMAVSGHKTRAIFDRYDIVSDKDRQDAAHRLEEAAQRRDSHNLAILPPISGAAQIGKDVN